MITFALFIWVTMKFIWPPVMAALAERQKKIAEGLAAAERGEHELMLAQKKVAEQIRETRVQAGKIIEEAKHRADQVIVEAQQRAREEGQRLLEVAQSDIAKEVQKAKKELQQQVATWAVAGAERILAQKIDVAANDALLKNLINDIEK